MAASPLTERALLTQPAATCQWGDDFRGAYNALNIFRRGKYTQLHGVPILAVTATATPSTRERIVKDLQLCEPVVRVLPITRPNIIIECKLFEARRR